MPNTDIQTRPVRDRQNECYSHRTQMTMPGDNRMSKQSVSRRLDTATEDRTAASAIAHIEMFQLSSGSAPVHTRYKRHAQDVFFAVATSAIHGTKRLSVRFHFQRAEAAFQLSSSFAFPVVCRGRAAYQPPRRVRLDSAASEGNASVPLAQQLFFPRCPF